MESLKRAIFLRKNESYGPSKTFYLLFQQIINFTFIVSVKYSTFPLYISFLNSFCQLVIGRFLSRIKRTKVSISAIWYSLNQNLRKSELTLGLVIFTRYFRVSSISGISLWGGNEKFISNKIISKTRGFRHYGASEYRRPSREILIGKLKPHKFAINWITRLFWARD